LDAEAQLRKHTIEFSAIIRQVPEAVKSKRVRVAGAGSTVGADRACEDHGQAYAFNRRQLTHM